jgi:hypothetical protein
MENDKRDPVIINNERKSNPLGWIIGLIVVVVLLLLFFSMGGFGLFSGAATDDSNSINVDTPDSVNVEPSGQ